jgi:hypothetical protein
VSACREDRQRDEQERNQRGEIAALLRGAGPPLEPLLGAKIVELPQRANGIYVDDPVDALALAGRDQRTELRQREVVAPPVPFAAFLVALQLVLQFRPDVRDVGDKEQLALELVRQLPRRVDRELPQVAAQQVLQTCAHLGGRQRRVRLGKGQEVPRLGDVLANERERLRELGAPPATLPVRRDDPLTEWP